RQQVGDPDEPAAAVAVREDLSRGVVVREAATDHRPDEAPRLVIEVDDQLSCHRAVAEGDDAGALFEVRVDDEAGDQTGVERTDVAERRPHVLGTRIDRDLLADGSHASPSFSEACSPPGYEKGIGPDARRDLAKVAL